MVSDSGSVVHRLKPKHFPVKCMQLLLQRIMETQRANTNTVVGGVRLLTKSNPSKLFDLVDNLRVLNKEYNKFYAHLY